jgi:GAF domain-containing protein
VTDEPTAHDEGTTPSATPDDAMSADLALVEALRAVALRIGAAGRLTPPAGTAILRSIVDATVGLFSAEAASIALYDAASDRLVFEVAAGTQGDGVIGLAIDASAGVAGYVFSTGQPIALSDVATDARFGRSAAEQTGYVPRSLVAVPLADDDGVLGVLEVLDKRGDAAFDLRDVELAQLFARQATVAIRATRIERDGAALFRTVLLAAGADGAPSAQIDEIVSAAVRALDAGEDVLWSLADEIALLRSADSRDLELVREILGILIQRANRPVSRRPGAGLRTTR